MSHSLSMRLASLLCLWMRLLCPRPCLCLRLLCHEMSLGSGIGCPRRGSPAWGWDIHPGPE
eukprot:9099666-Lingulodinium_polyedra.AAC.1